MDSTAVDTEIPALLRDVVPSVGSIWAREPLKPHASERTRVTAVRWNGEAVWVESVGENGQKAWNELGRWVEATVLIDPGRL